MTKSRSFDRAANYYDNTRLLLAPIEQYGIPALQQLMGANARLLEAGCGTGRISIPLMERGVDVVGCDLSAEMLHRFQEKYPSPRIVQTDASLLPFPVAHFDAVLTVHVLHLIPVWRDVLREFKRVLKPGGLYLNVRTHEMVENSTSDRIRNFWRDSMKEHGIDALPIGVRSHTELLEELQSIGAQVSEVEAVRYTDSFNLQERIENFAKRLYSETWDIPDEIFNEGVKELRAWVRREYGNLDRDITDEFRFLIHVARF